MAYEKMLPGVLTMGFLGNDIRPLAEIIMEDEQEFIRLGLDFEDVANRLEVLKQAGEKGLGEPITVEETAGSDGGDARGMLPCPWGDGLYHKNAISVQPADKPQEACVEGEDMLIFLTFRFTCCGCITSAKGLGSPFRLDPVFLKQLIY